MGKGDRLRAVATTSGEVPEAENAHRASLLPEHEMLQAALPDLKRLARYERRAWSRRSRAFRRFIEIKRTLRLRIG
jgi:hypothetical protein